MHSPRLVFQQSSICHPPTLTRRKDLSKKKIYIKEEKPQRTWNNREAAPCCFFFSEKTEPEPREDQAPSQPSLFWIDVSQWSPVSKRHPLRCHLSAPSAIYSTKRALSGTKASNTARSIFPICCKRSPTIGRRESSCYLWSRFIKRVAGSSEVPIVVCPCARISSLITTPYTTTYFHYFTARNATLRCPRISLLFLVRPPGCLLREVGFVWTPASHAQHGSLISAGTCDRFFVGPSLGKAPAQSGTPVPRPTSARQDPSTSPELRLPPASFCRP